MVPAREIVGPARLIAEARWGSDGSPLIVYGAGYFSMPGFMQRWIAAHECGHLNWYASDEFAANCFALRSLRPDGDMLDKIASFHRSMGHMSPQYGGSGSAFWRGTLAACGY